MPAKNVIVLWIITIAALLVAVTGGWYYHRHSTRPPAEAAGPAAQAPATPASGSVNQSNNTAGRRVHTAPFAPLTAQPVPGFLKGVTTANDLKVSFYYEGDERTPSDDQWYVDKTSVANEQGENYLLVPSVIDSQTRYGPTELQIFKNQESHAYQGIPFSILNPASHYSLQYVALKINDPRLVKHLSVELGIDYRSDDNGDVLDEAPRSSASLALPISLTSWWSPPAVYACGPGLYLRPVGSSSLLPVQTENGVAWYKLEKPISLYNLPLDYCDKTTQAKAPGEKLKAKDKIQDDADNEEDDADMDAFCAPIKDLAGGQLRLHLLYKPNGVAGALQIQAVNFILQDPGGRYFQPAIQKNLTRYYKAFLVDKNCLAAKQPADCAVQ